MTLKREDNRQRVVTIVQKAVLTNRHTNYVLSQLRFCCYCRLRGNFPRHRGCDLCLLATNLQETCQNLLLYFGGVVLLYVPVLPRDGIAD